ncbi:flavin reductase family protein [Streptantibioticus rubrisoli]|uniref:Flavin reductase family protein n=1 Tax=Streptantibioticus rubrisoli TaxID=1387313 RepID=A0ABT1PIA1_9ACTN|nr:flavin reductase family protein [Streptantibioticus rubrisoli]MCQ4044521.1 flavin reductase family protein [Streptantibioticus rubrisoli]
MGTAPPVRSHVDPQAFRQVLGHVPTTVTVVTAGTDEGPAGLVVGSFVSISLRPALVGVFIDEASVSWPAIHRTGSFAVNVLAHDQQAVCARFARSGGDKFAGLDHRLSPHGHPLLPGTTAWLDCEIEDVRKLGDHFFALAGVTDLGTSQGVLPMVFHRGALHTIADGSAPGS